MIEFYLGEHAILNNVQTYMLRDPKQRAARARTICTSWSSRKSRARAATAC